MAEVSNESSYHSAVGSTGAAVSSTDGVVSIDRVNACASFLGGATCCMVCWSIASKAASKESSYHNFSSVSCS